MIDIAHYEGTPESVADELGAIVSLRISTTHRRG